MPTTQSFPVKDLTLDLKNYRTIHQRGEKGAVNALITLKPEWFWELMKSLIADGYSPTENIIVLNDGKNHVVKEGNRRIASLKIILGHISGIDIPDDIKALIKALPANWIKQNSSVPCAIYTTGESATVDAIVSRTHGYNEKAARLRWESVARVRHARDFANTPAPELDLLEKYIKHGKNASDNQKEVWAGDYQISILEEAVKKLTPCLGYAKGSELVAAYPKSHATIIDKIVYAIGEGTLGFKEIRAADPFWGDKYGFPRPAASNQTAGATGGTGSAAGGGAASGAGGATAAGATSQAANAGSGGGTKSSGPNAAASNDPKSVVRKLKEFKIKGKGRDKIEALRREIYTLKIETQPHAFCFVLRSMFELSAKAYCADQKSHGGPSTKDKKTGQDRNLVDVLRDVTNFITKNNTDRDKLKLLHGAMTEMAKKDGIISVTSLNQLIHNPTFSVAPSDICITFTNVFPLLEEMNK